MFKKTGNDRETEDESSCKNEEKVGSDLSDLLEKNSETDQKETKIQVTDHLEEKMEDIGALRETDNLSKSDTIEDDTIVEKVVNKDENASPQLEDNKNTKEQADTDDMLISHVTQVD